MGFSVKYRRTEVALAPISLWHRYQVNLTQDSRFDHVERLDNGIVADKYFVQVTVDYMHVLIECDANFEKPTFEVISIFVKPQSQREELDRDKRKQCQVDLADNLVGETSQALVRDVSRCWVRAQSHLALASKLFKTSRQSKSSVELAELKKRVTEYGLGRKMQWVVGHGDVVMED
jgi:hypothetical protein